MAENTKHWILDEHPNYTENAPRWQFYLDQYEGGPDWAQKINPIRYGNGSGIEKPSAKHSGVSRYLWQHPLEDHYRFEHRLNRASFADILSPVIDFYAGAIGKGIQIESGADKDFEEFLDDADMRGCSLLQVMEEARTSAQVFGVTFLLIDAPRVNTEIRTEADAKAANLRPYLREITPLAMRNWRCSPITGELLEVTFEVFPEISSKIQESGQSKSRRFFYWSQNEWQEWMVEAGDKEEKVALLGQGVNQIGKVPVVALFNKRVNRRGPLAGESLVKNTARTAVLLSNWLSSVDESAENQMFAQLVVEASEAPSEIGVGATQCVHLRPDRNEKIYYVAPDTAPFEAVWTAFFRMWAMANVLMGCEAPNISDTPENKSGISKQWDYIKADKIMLRLAQNEQEAVKQILEIAGLWMDTTGKKKFAGQVRYPTEFDTQTVQDALSGIIQAQAAGMPPAVLRELKKKYVAKALPSADEEVKMEIDKQLESDIAANDLFAGAAAGA